MANSVRSLGILAVLVVLSDGTPAGNPALAAEKIISAQEAYDLSVKNRLTVIDIRSPQEWLKSGVPKGARTITMHDPRGKRAFLKAIREAVSGDTTHPIAVICAVGGRSHWVRRFLTQNGFSNVVDISEGLFGRGDKKPGWLNRQLPIESCDLAANRTAVRCGGN